MKTITKKINVYSLEELKSVDVEQYEKEINSLEEKLIEDNFYFLQEELQEELATYYNLPDFDVYYSLSYCQGDGVCFYNKNKNILNYTHLKNEKDLNVFEKHILAHYSQEDIDLILKYLNEDYTIRIVKNSFHYEHAYTCCIDYEYYTSDNDCEEIKMYKLLDRLTKDLFDNVYVKVCGELERIGYKCYDIEEEDCIEYAKEFGLEYEVEAH